MPLTESQLNAYYGRPRTFQPVAVQTRLPWLPRRADGRVQVVLAHPLIADELVAACRAAAQASNWVPQRIDSYVPRAIRGVDTSGGWKLGDPGTSRHSWAVAFDFFATPADVPPPGGVWTPDNPVPDAFGQVFESRGWSWGKRWRRTDIPHIEYSAPPPTPTSPEGIVDWLTGLLKQGDTGPEVFDLQYMIRAAGVALWPSGIFDSPTAGAVRSIQEAAGITVDAIAGPQTEQAINGIVAARYDSMPDVVTSAYRDVLGRLPDDQGLAFWVEQLESGAGVHTLWGSLWNSEEGKRRRSQNILDLERRLAEAKAGIDDAKRLVAAKHDEIRQIRARMDQAAVLVGDALEVLHPD